MQLLRNEKGFVQWIPLAIVVGFVLYVVGALAWAEFDWWFSHNSRNAVEIEKTKADVEKRRIDLSEKQLGEVMRQNHQLIEQNQDAMNKITVAYVKAGEEISGAHRDASDRVATMAQDVIAMKTDRTMVFILAAISVFCVLVSAGVVLLMARKPLPLSNQPTIVYVNAGEEAVRLLGTTNSRELVKM